MAKGQNIEAYVIVNPQYPSIAEKVKEVLAVNGRRMPIELFEQKVIQRVGFLSFDKVDFLDADRMRYFMEKGFIIYPIANGVVYECQDLIVEE